MSDTKEPMSALNRTLYWLGKALNAIVFARVLVFAVALALPSFAALDLKLRIRFQGQFELTALLLLAHVFLIWVSMRRKLFVRAERLYYARGATSNVRPRDGSSEATLIYALTIIVQFLWWSLLAFAL